MMATATESQTAGIAVDGNASLMAQMMERLFTRDAEISIEKNVNASVDSSQPEMTRAIGPDADEQTIWWRSAAAAATNGDDENGDPRRVAARIGDELRRLQAALRRCELLAFSAGDHRSTIASKGTRTASAAGDDRTDAQNRVLRISADDEENVEHVNENPGRLERAMDCGERELLALCRWAAGMSGSGDDDERFADMPQLQQRDGDVLYLAAMAYFKVGVLRALCCGSGRTAHDDDALSAAHIRALDAALFYRSDNNCHDSDSDPSNAQLSTRAIVMMALVSAVSSSCASAVQQTSHTSAESSSVSKTAKKFIQRVCAAAVDPHWETAVYALFGRRPAAINNNNQPRTCLEILLDLTQQCMHYNDNEYVQLLAIQCWSGLASALVFTLVFSDRGVPPTVAAHQLMMVRDLIGAAPMLRQPLVKRLAQAFQGVVALAATAAVDDDDDDKNRGADAAETVDAKTISQHDIWMELMQLSWQTRIKFILMSAFLRKCRLTDARVVAAVDGSDIVQQCFSAIEMRDMHSYAADLLSSFLKRRFHDQKQQGSGERWAAAWLPRVREFADSGYLEQHLRSFELQILPGICQSWPQQFLAAVERCESDATTPVLLLLVLYKVVLDSNEVRISEPSLAHIEELLPSYMNHENYVCKLLVLSIIVQAERRFHAVTDGRFTELFLDFIECCISPHLAIEFVDCATVLIRKYLQWRVDFVSKRWTARAKLSRQLLFASLDTSPVPTWAEFFTRFFKIMTENLFEGASFTRSCFALRGLSCLLYDALGVASNTPAAITQSTHAIKLLECVKPHMYSFYAENRRVASRLVEILYPYCGGAQNIKILSVDDALAIFEHLHPLYKVEGAIHALRTLWPHQSVEIQGHVINSLYSQLFDCIHGLALVFDDYELGGEQSEAFLSKAVLIRRTRDSPIPGLMLAFETLLPHAESLLSAENFKELILMAQKVMQMSSKFFQIMYEQEGCTAAAGLQDNADDDEHNDSDLEGEHLDECDVLSSDHIVQAGTKYVAILQRFFWRAIQYSSNLLVTLLTTPAVARKISEAEWLLKLDQSTDLLQVILWKSRHWGAVKALFGNFTRLFKFLNNIDQDFLSDPQNIVKLRQRGRQRLDSILDQVLSGNTGFNVERADDRYAGLAYSLHAIILAEMRFLAKKAMVNHLVERLCGALAAGNNEVSDEQARLNALNIFRSMCADRLLGHFMQRHVITAIQCSLAVFLSDSAPIRSAATALFTVSIQRFFDPSQTIFELLQLTPGLETALHDFMCQCAESVAGNATVSHNVFPILLLLSRMTAQVPRQTRQRVADDASDEMNVAIFRRWKPLLLKLLGSAIWKVREMSAKAILVLIPCQRRSEEIDWLYGELCAKLATNQQPLNQNYVHGLTLLLDSLLFTLPQREHFIKLEPLLVLWTDRLGTLSALSSSQLCETFEKALLWMEQYSHRDSSIHRMVRCLSDMIYICFRNRESAPKGPGNAKFRLCSSKLLFTVITNPGDILKWNIGFLRRIDDEDSYVGAIRVLRYRLGRNELDGRIANEVKLYQFQQFLAEHAKSEFMRTNKVRHEYFRMFLEIEKYTRSPATEAQNSVLQRITRRIIHSTLISSCPSSVRCASLECIGYLLSINQQPQDEHVEIFLNFVERWSRPDRASNYRMACLLALQPILLRASLENKTRCLLWLILMRFLSTEDEPEILQVLVENVNQIAGGLPGLMDFNLARRCLAEMLMGSLCRQTATMLYDGCLLMITLDSHWLSMLESPFSGIFQSIPMHSAPPGSKREPHVDLQVWILPLLERATDFLQSEGMLTCQEFLHDFNLITDIMHGTGSSDQEQRDLLSRASLILFSAVRKLQND